MMNDEVQNLMTLKVKLDNFLKISKSPFSKSFVERKINELNSRISSIVSSKNSNIVLEQVSKLETLEGGFSNNGMWKLKSKLFPKSPNPPIAKNDKHGNSVTNHGSLKKLYLETKILLQKICDTTF